MRTRILLVLTAVCFAVIGAAPAQAVEEHPGCKGIDKAFSKASTQGKAALTTVAEKFGCGGINPDPVDPTPCPTGQTSLARWTYTGTGTLDPVYNAWGNWTGSWALTSGSATAATPTMNANPDASGFYWSEGSPDLVQSIVMQSYSGEVVTVLNSMTADPSFFLDPTKVVSQNWFVNRTGINLVNFCGTTNAA